MLTHLDNILELVIKNMIFNKYYNMNEEDEEIKESKKSEANYIDDIIEEIYMKTFYDSDDSLSIKTMVWDAIDSPLEFNFEILGYFQLKEIYDKFTMDNPSHESDFYDILLNNAFSDPNFIKEFKLSNFYE